MQRALVRLPRTLIASKALRALGNLCAPGGRTSYSAYPTRGRCLPMYPFQRFSPVLDKPAACQPKESLLSFPFYLKLSLYKSISSLFSVNCGMCSISSKSHQILSPRDIGFIQPMPVVAQRSLENDGVPISHPPFFWAGPAHVTSQRQGRCLCQGRHKHTSFYNKDS